MPDTELGQKMFDALHPALSHSRCVNWRAKNQWARETAQTIGGAIHQVRTIKDEAKKRVAMEALTSRLNQVVGLMIAANCKHLNIRYRSPDNIVGQIMQRPTAAYQVLREAALAMIAEREQIATETTH